MSTLLGWTISQWAEAAGWYELVNKCLPERTLAGARIIRHTWFTNRMDEPGNQRIIEVAHLMNYAWANSMFENVIRESGCATSASWTRKT